MAGHSKWSNIKRKKGEADAKRGKVFTKIAREIFVATRAGGDNPDMNPALRDALAKAKQQNVPNDNIERAIKKATGEDSEDSFEEMTYEGYGPEGVAIIVETLTDNRNRTAGDLRHYFDKYGGNLGTTGCVSYMFENKGIIVLESEGIDEEKLLEDVLLMGAEDYALEDTIYEIYTEPAKIREAREYMEKAGYTLLSSETEKIPSTTVSTTDEATIEKLEKLIETIEDNDDVQNVWSNWNIPD